MASLTTCRLHGAAIQRASPLGPGRALTLPCGWNNAGRGEEEEEEEEQDSDEAAEQAQELRARRDAVASLLGGQHWARQ